MKVRFNGDVPALGVEAGDVVDVSPHEGTFFVDTGSAVAVDDEGVDVVDELVEEDEVVEEDDDKSEDAVDDEEDAEELDEDDDESDDAAELGVAVE